MRANRASMTAAVVAAWRTLGAALPPSARLVDDPYGIAFAPKPLALFLRAAQRVPLFATLPSHRGPILMQVRTRAIDDAVDDFTAGSAARDPLDASAAQHPGMAPGDQVVLLGAGFDCRAVRLPSLRDKLVLEVDHPATQRRKRAVLERLGARPDNVRYIPWDFAAQPMSELPARLREAGLDPKQRTLTIWEGVTMYLPLPAIEATLQTIKAYSAPGSWLCFMYLEQRVIQRPDLFERLVHATVRVIGEPFHTGFDPRTVPAWLAARGFTLLWDRDENALVAHRLPAYALTGPPKAHHTLSAIADA